LEDYGLAIVLDAEPGFEQARPDLASAEPCQLRAIEVDSTRLTCTTAPG